MVHPLSAVTPSLSSPLLTALIQYIGVGVSKFLYDRYLTISLKHFSVSEGKVSCGGHTLDSINSNEEILNIKEFIMHPNYYYDYYTATNDIAVVKLEGSFNCSRDKIYPACLPNTEVSLTFLVSLDTDIPC